MPRDKIKPPTESKIDLMGQIVQLAQEQWPHDPISAIEWFLIFFTSADLAGIRDELKGMRKR